MRVTEEQNRVQRWTQTLYYRILDPARNNQVPSVAVPFVPFFAGSVVTFSTPLLARNAYLPTCLCPLHSLG